MRQGAGAGRGTIQDENTGDKMKNPFEAHDIKHLSPSSINAFIASPSLFVMERILKRRAPVGAPAHAGNAAEAGIVHGCVNQSATLEECADIAAREYARLAALCGDPRKEKYREVLPDMVRHGLAELRPYGVPSRTQGAVEHRVDGLAVLVVGYFDLEYAEHGILIDLKTTLRLPSEIKSGHARQIALYQAALSDNMEARIAYVTDKKAATYRLENHREHLRSLEKAALTIQRFLSISDSADELAALTAPDLDSFYFSDPVARANAAAIWG